MKGKQVLVDVRMSRHSGIGVYLTNVLSILKDVPEFKLLRAGNDEDREKNTSVLKSEIYSIKEQIEYPFRIPAVDIFWSPHYNAPLFPTRARKTVVTIHDVYHLAYAHTLSPFQKIYARLMINAAVRLSDAVITVSEFSKSEILKYTGCDPGKITVIHNGVKQKTVLKERVQTTQKYGISQQPYILFVGNVKPHKNLSTFLKAFTELPEDLYHAYQVVIVGKKDGMITGDAKLFSWINETADLSKKLTFTGIVDDEDLDTIYAGASLFVFPSYYEGFGLPPLEAMVNGCPVIAAKSSSLPEVCGDAVLYFNPESSASIGAAIAAVLTNGTTAATLITKGYARATQFTWENSAGLHKKLFERLLS
jgi:glycosyltransferase involved in cell wall biosynthesis